MGRNTYVESQPVSIRRKRRSAATGEEQDIAGASSEILACSSLNIEFALDDVLGFIEFILELHGIALLNAENAARDWLCRLSIYTVMPSDLAVQSPRRNGTIHTSRNTQYQICLLMRSMLVCCQQHCGSIEQ
jgi:hypothetical protein